MNQEFVHSLTEMLQEIVEMETKVDTYRQLLSQQIQFNLKDLYIEVGGNSPLTNAYHLRDFLNDPEHQYNLTVFESMVKSYNNCTSMNLSFIEFSLIFLSRQNRLLAKIVLQRNSLGSIPLYLLNYARKILILQYQLHKRLIQFRKSFSQQAEVWIDNIIFQSEEGDFLNQLLLQGFCKENQINYECLIRNLKIVHNKKVDKKRLLSLFTLKNSKNIKKFLSKTVSTKINTKFNSQKISLNPFIRPEFHDCLERPEVMQNFSRREIKSIEKHFDRMNNNHKKQLSSKIKKYRDFIEKQLKVVCQAIKEIIWLQKQIEYERIQLCLCTDFYPVLFFESIDKDRDNLIIPSSFKDYLSTFGIQIQLSHVFTLFKRYSKNEGKLDFNDFCSIFDVFKTAYSRIQKNRRIKCLDDIELETKKHFFKLIKLIIKNEISIEKIKRKICKNKQINLRNIFSLLDTDEDGYLSILDLRIGWKKYLLLDLPEEQAELLWFRMGLQKNTMIKYEKFIYEMSPKTNFKEKKN